MGFLKNFSEPFAFALALWPFVSMLLTVPVLALLQSQLPLPVLP